MIDFDGDDPRGHDDEPSRLARDLPWLGGLMALAGWGLLLAAAIALSIAALSGGEARLHVESRPVGGAGDTAAETTEAAR